MKDNFKGIREKRAVKPIRNLEEIERINFLLKNRTRDLLLFVLAIQSGLPMKEILGLKVKDVRNLEINDPIPSTSERAPQMTKDVYKQLHGYFIDTPLRENDYLFKSRKGSKPLTLSSVSNLIKGWFKEAGIPGTYGAKSLRKTYEFFYNPEKTTAGTSEDHFKGRNFLEPIESRSIQEKVYDTLRNAIMSGKMMPGMKLAVNQISQSLNVSQMPVREALRALSAKGYVSYQRNKGMVVSALSESNFRELMTIRFNLESLAIREACERWNGKTTERLETVLLEFKITATIEEIWEVNREFHLMLYRDANMPLLQEMVADLMDRCSPYFHLYAAKSKTLNAVLMEAIPAHQGILKGICNRDPNEAINSLKKDYDLMIPKIVGIMDLIKSQPPDTL